MRNRPWAPALAAALSLLSTCGMAVAQQPGQNNLERVVVAARKGDISQWFRAESQRFVVYSDAQEDDVVQLLNNLEKLDQLLRIYTQPLRQAEQPEPKLTLYYHRSASDLREIEDSVPADAVGLYSSCASAVQGFGVHLERVPSLGDEQLDKAPLNETLSYAFEAYARHFLYRHTDIRTPASFIDGFAQYFSSVRFSEKQMVLGRVPRALASYLRFLNDGRRYSLEYEDVLQNKLDDAHNFAGAAGVHLEFEAKSWLLTHYMLSSDDHRKRLNRYLVLAGQGLAPTAAFERAFDVKTADLGTVMWRYGLRGMQVLRVVAPPSLPVARISFRTLPRATGEFILADAALKACPSRQAGESLLKKITALAARAPNDDLGRLALSRAQIDWGNPQDVLPRLSAMLRDDDAHFEARYLLGMANLRLAARSDGDARRAYLDAAQRHLQRARGSNPRSPEVALAAFKAEVAATEVPGGPALDGVITAWQGAREVDELARSAALAYAYAGQADEAHQTLASLAQNVHDAPMAQWAQQWQRRLETGVKRDDILAEMRRDGVPDAPLKEWTIDKQRVMQTVERAYGMESAASFMKEQASQNANQPANNIPGGTDRR